LKKELVLDGTKLIHHLDRLNSWMSGKGAAPILIEISPVGSCNQGCIFCAYEYLKKNTDRLDTQRMKKVFSEFCRMGVKAVFFSGEGEPLLHPDLAYMVRYAHSVGLDCALNTNGILLTKHVSYDLLRHLSWVRFSINAGSSASYARIHRARKDDFQRLVKNLKDAVEIKRKQRLETSLGIQLVYIGQPVREILGLAQLLKKIGLDYFAIKQFNKHPLSKFDVRISKKDIERLREAESLADKDFYVTVRESFDPQRQKRNYKKCFGMDFFAEIKCDGGVYPCGPLLGIKEYCYGNIYKSDFSKIWHSRKRKSVVNRIYRRLDICACMPNCRLHSVNDFLWKLKEVPAHVNFI
jgi:MoaA/NifB/PqqE/SkfB family radical SAM enzyme